MKAATRSARTGYAMAVGAAGLFAVNGTVSKTALGAGLSPERLTALRCLGAAAGLLIILLAIAPQTLRITRRELPLIAAYGVLGVAMTQWLYFVAIGRLPIGVALLLEFTAPLLVALYARFVLREPLRHRAWAALSLSLAGLGLVARPWDGGGSLDGLGVAAGLGAAVALAAFYLLGERAVSSRDPISLTFWSVLAAAIFWSVAAPWWTFDPAVLTAGVDVRGDPGGSSAPLWLLVAWVVVMGTIVPFCLSVGALRHLSATSVGIAATAEPVLAGAVAWLWLSEVLAPLQVLGGAVVVAGIVLAQTARSERWVGADELQFDGASADDAKAAVAAAR